MAGSLVANVSGRQASAAGVPAPNRRRAGSGGATVEVAALSPPRHRLEGSIMSFDHLFSPVSIGTLTLPHRGIMPSMVVNLCGLDGSVTDRFIAYHVARAHG